MLNRS